MGNFSSLVVNVDQKVMQKVGSLDKVKVLAVLTGFFTLNALWQTYYDLRMVFGFVRMFTWGVMTHEPGSRPISTPFDLLVLITPLLSMVFIWALTLIVWIVRTSLLRRELTDRGDSGAIGKILNAGQ